MHARPRGRGAILRMSAVIIAIIAATVCGCLQTSTQSSPAAAPPNAPPNGTAPIRSDYAAGEITRLSVAAEASANASLDAIAAIPAGDRSIETTLLAFERTMADYGDATQPLALMGYVHPDPAIAAEGTACEEATGVFSTATYSRRNLYDAVRPAVPRMEEESRLYNVTVRRFEQNGLNLSDERLSKVRSMRDDLNRLQVRFLANLNNDTTTLEFADDELAGLPASTVEAFGETANGTCLVAVKYPGYMAIMTKAERGETRKRMYAAYNNRQAEENTRLLEEAIDLRQRIAKELGYDTWADYKIEGRMAGSSDTVMAFLASLQAPLLEKNRAEFAELLRLKRVLDPAASTVEPWDVLYLQERLKRERYAYDEETVKEYFPVDGVLEGVFGIAYSLFDVQFEEVRDAKVWAPGVRLYRVANATDRATIGYLYLDLYPREGKYGYFAAETMIQGRKENGSYVTPVVLVMANFQAPEGGRPSLMTQDEIETLFHETGHALHVILTRAPYGSLSGFETEWDFSETPSQAFEEWPWDPEVLELLSGHYANSSQKIPPELRDRIIASRNVGMSYEFSRVLANSLEDMRFHTTRGPVDVTEVSHETYEEVTGIAPLPETHQPAQFEHVMSGYDAGYYGYLWSKVYALECVDEFRREGMTDRATGMRFRHAILEQGNMKDGGVLLEEFLGREPGNQALFRHLGINGSQATT